MVSGPDTDSARDLLFEIGVEELPAAAARDAASQAGPATLDAFISRRLDIHPDDVSVWVSPRRIAVMIRNLPEKQEASERVERGPAHAAAFDEDGKPTRAAEGFASAKGIDVEELEVREHDGKKFVFAVHREEGRAAAELVPEACEQLLNSFVFPKTMRWDSSGMRFSRPVRWLLAKLGDTTIEFEAGGLKSTDSSRGHRFIGKPQVVVGSADSYREQLREAAVQVDQEERRRVIVAGLKARSEELGAEYFDPAGQLEEVIYLVENPSVQQGSFKGEHLRLPEGVLVTAMQSHQRYFPLKGKDGTLVSSFLHVINGDPNHSEGISEGNQRVLEGRLEDAEFSYDKDLDTGIESMRDSLEDVVFHHRLGSMADKAARLEGLALYLSGKLGLDDHDTGTTVKAAQLAKADLVSIMVQEFPTLEGYMGSQYAAIEGYPGEVCDAIRDHYLPVTSGGDLPATVPGAVLSLSDKVDSMVGAFSVDELPTGSRDPYGLRRAAAGIFEISRQFDFDFDLSEVLAQSHKLLVEQGADVNLDSAAFIDSVISFIGDRIQHRAVEQGLPVEVFEAARTAGILTTNRLFSLAQALEEFRREPGFEDLHTAYFRCSKIAAKAGKEPETLSIDESLFAEDAESSLYDDAKVMEKKIRPLIESGDYRDALAEAAMIRDAVDRFFDDVMVMDKDERLRANRLALVSWIAAMLGELGDPMKVAAAPKG